MLPRELMASSLLMFFIACDDSSLTVNKLEPIDMAPNPTSVTDRDIVNQVQLDMAELMDMSVVEQMPVNCAETSVVGCPCQENSACESGLCVPTNQGVLKVCSAYCDLMCDEPSLDCVRVDTDETAYTACLPFVSQCDTCQDSADCGNDLAACILNGDQQVCAAPCGVNQLCPQGSVCTELEDEDMLKTVCMPSLSQCLGDECDPTPESCDGLDNDCDELIDENFDFVNDLFNCGSCGVSCPDNTVCVEGACQEEGCGDETNECGGCEILDGQLGTPCGVCGEGLFVCDGLDALRCEGQSMLDADQDGVPDECDQCTVGDDAEDIDNDEVPDTCDCDLSNCSVNATCESSASGRSCTCNEGYEGNGFECDLNECLENNGGCDPLTLCTNTTLGRDCGSCPEGYEGNGETGCIAPGAICPETCAEAIELPRNTQIQVASGRINDYSNYSGMCSAGEESAVSLLGSECIYSVSIPPRSYLETTLFDFSASLRIVLSDACPFTENSCHSISGSIVNYVNEGDVPLTVYVAIEATASSTEQNIVMTTGPLETWTVWRDAYCGGVDRLLALDLAAEQLWARFYDLRSARTVPGGTWNANGRRNLYDGYWNPDGVSCGATPHKAHGEESLIPYILGAGMQVNLSINQIYRRHQAEVRALGFVIEEDCSELGVQNHCIGTFDEDRDFLLQNTSDRDQTYYIIIDSENDREWTEGALDLLNVTTITP